MTTLRRFASLVLLAALAWPAQAQVLKGYVTQSGWQSIPRAKLEEGFAPEQMGELTLTVRGKALPFVMRQDALLFSVTDVMLDARPRLPFFVRARRASEATVAPAADPGPQERGTEPSTAFVSPPNLASSALGADYLIVAADPLLAAVQPLIQHRQSEGLRVLAFSMTQVADALNEGLVEPIAVERLVRLAWQSWQKPAPRYLLIAGDACLDRELPGMALVPCAMTQTVLSGATGSDHPFSLADDDLLPDLAVGRLPARTPEELAGMVSRILTYESETPAGRWQKSLAVVAGEGRFGEMADALIEKTFVGAIEDGVPPGYDVTMTYAAQSSPYLYVPTELHAHVVRELCAGPLFFTYVGHGARDAFDDLRFGGKRYPVLRVKDVSHVRVQEGGGAPVVVVIACSTGAFDDPRGPCIGEELLKDDRAIAFLGASRDSHPYANAMFGLALVETIFQAKHARLGDALVAAKRALVTPSPFDVQRIALDAAATML